MGLCGRLIQRSRISLLAAVAAVAALLAFGLGASPCHADPIWATGRSLLEVIQFDMEAHDNNQRLSDYQTNAVCLLLGYFTGFVESSALAAHYDATALPFFLPESITNEEIEQVVYDYLTQNPDKLDMKGGALVVAALAQAYPNPTFKPPNVAAAPQTPPATVKRMDEFSNTLLSGS
jgi:hypothetical protein